MNLVRVGDPLLVQVGEGRGVLAEAEEDRGRDRRRGRRTPRPPTSLHLDVVAAGGEIERRSSRRPRRAAPCRRAAPGARRPSRGTRRRGAPWRAPRSPAVDPVADVAGWRRSRDAEATAARTAARNRRFMVLGSIFRPGSRRSDAPPRPISLPGPRRGGSPRATGFRCTLRERWPECLLNLCKTAVVIAALAPVGLAAVALHGDALGLQHHALQRVHAGGGLVDLPGEGDRARPGSASGAPCPGCGPSGTRARPRGGCWRRRASAARAPPAGGRASPPCGSAGRPAGRASPCPAARARRGRPASSRR